jgi:hypothetical protein
LHNNSRGTEQPASDATVAASGSICTVPPNAAGRQNSTSLNRSTISLLQQQHVQKREKEEHKHVLGSSQALSAAKLRLSATSTFTTAAATLQTKW